MRPPAVPVTPPLHVTVELDYALRALVVLSRDRSGPRTAASVAGPDMSVRFLHAILGRLGTAGVLTARRGTNGGYWLDRPAEEITVGEVVRAITPPGEPVLPSPATARTDGWWRALDARVQALLEETTIADLAGD